MAVRHRSVSSDYARRPNTSEPHICPTQFVPTHALLVTHFHVSILSWRHVPVSCGLHNTALYAAAFVSQEEHAQP